MKASRRLCAIMFTDIEGYTRLMRESEARAVAIRQRHREVFQEHTRAFGGEIIHYYGDGTLSIFDSTVNAVRCAAALQRSFREDPALPVRIGIHTGDIIRTEDDIIGDSVNLASRVESLAVAGSVLVSGKVADEIRSHPDLPLQRLGKFLFKSEGKKREVYALDLPGLEIPKPKTIRGKLEPEQPFWKKKGARPALAAVVLLVLLSSYFLPRLGSAALEPADIRKLAVLPFTDPVRDTSQRHIIEGVHEAIISELYRAGIEVVPRSSMLAYRDNEKGIHDIARELGVDALVQGTVLRRGDSLNIDLLLIQDDGKAGDIVWEQTFPAEVKDLFILYRDVTKAIAGEIELALSPEVEELLDASAREVNAQALELYLKGRRKGANDPGHLDESIAYYEEALVIDPDFGPAYTGLVEAYLLKGFGNIDPFEAHTRFRIYAQRALELDPATADAHHLKAMIHIFSELDWGEAEKEIQQALEAGGETPDLLDTYCQFLWATGRTSESVDMGRRAIAAGPDHHYAHCDLAWAYFYDGQLEAARDMVDLTTARFGDSCSYHRNLGYRLDFARDLDSLELAALLETSLQDYREYGDPFNGYVFPAQILIRLGRTPEAREYLYRAESAAQEGYFDPSSLALIYTFFGDKDKAFESLEKAYLRRSFLLLYALKAAPDFAPLRDDPRFEDLLRRMNLAKSPES